MMKSRICQLHATKDIRVHLEDVPQLQPSEVQIAVGAGGICGTDLHYYNEGGIGPIRVREPIILGHEAAGRVVVVGDDVQDLKSGDIVALCPSQPCNTCDYCAGGQFNHCLKMRFIGSAMRLPHEQGMFRDVINLPARQCIKASEGITIAEAACTEPLAVCLRAVQQVGDLTGKRVLVTGAGPIGLLCTALAKMMNAKEIVTTDLEDFALGLARDMGATHTVNMRRQSEDFETYTSEKGYFDVALECTAASAAIRNAIQSVRPHGTIVQVGVAGDTVIPLNLLVAKEINLRGTHRFHNEYAEALELISAGKINVLPMITHTFPMENVQEALELASDRSIASKVHLSFEAATE